MTEPDYDELLKKMEVWFLGQPRHRFQEARNAIMGLRALNHSLSEANRLLIERSLMTERVEDFVPTFDVGDEVMKVTGDYHIRGEVRSRFCMRNGAVRYVVEHRAEGGGSFLHIYAGKNLRKLDEVQDAEQTLA